MTHTKRESVRRFSVFESNESRNRDIFLSSFVVKILSPFSICLCLLSLCANARRTECILHVCMYIFFSVYFRCKYLIVQVYLNVLEGGWNDLNCHLFIFHRLNRSELFQSFILFVLLSIYIKNRDSNRFKILSL